MYLSRKVETKIDFRKIMIYTLLFGAIYVVRKPLFGEHVRPSVRLFVLLYFCNTTSITKLVAGH